MSADSVSNTTRESSRGIPASPCQGVPDTLPPPIHLARLAWLKARPRLLAALPGAAEEDLTIAHLQALDDALRGMQRAKLYVSSLLYRPPGLRWEIRRLVSELRGDVVPDSWEGG